MLRANFIAGWMATALLSAAVVVPASPCFAQRNSYRPVQGRQAAPNKKAQQPQHPGHAGDWLRKHKDMTPAERERALENDPGFRRLPPERQQQLRQRLEHFSNLPPQQQQRMLDNMDRWAHLTPEQKQQAREVHSRLQALPPERQNMVKTAVRHLSAMSPDERERIINSDRFKGMFSPEERDIVRGAARLPLAAPENGKPEEPPAPEQ